ncbi:hypothetical protein ACFPA8_02580 [Streptomyces ovatisporus]|uniref:Uncharacterized protein n=1 Tax=Streptomyces ovatisporus TaxID=1128682 RepID=A0ABV9A1V2_9ACTN
MDCPRAGQCLPGLAHRGEDFDPITALCEAQQRGLTVNRDPDELSTLLTRPAGSHLIAGACE